MQQGASIKGKCLSEATTHTNNTPSPLPSRFPPSPLDLEECWKVSCHQHFPAALSELWGGGGGFFFLRGTLPRITADSSRSAQEGNGWNLICSQTLAEPERVLLERSPGRHKPSFPSHPPKIKAFPMKLYFLIYIYIYLKNPLR